MVGAAIAMGPTSASCLVRLYAALATLISWVWPRYLRGSGGAHKQDDSVRTTDDVDVRVEKAFASAAERAMGLPQLSTAVRLNLYALYKQSTVGDAPSAPSSSVLDAAGRIKWQCWSKLSGTPRETAMVRYTDAVREAEDPTGSGGGDTDDLLDGVPLAELEEAFAGFAGPRAMSSLAGVEPDEADLPDEIGLHAAARRGDSAGCQALLASGADVDVLDEDRHTALHWACDQGHAGVARLLLSEGADADAQNCDGSTPLHMAVTCEHLDVAKLLLACGASSTVCDDDGSTAVELAPAEIKAEIEEVIAGLGTAGRP